MKTPINGIGGANPVEVGGDDAALRPEAQFAAREAELLGSRGGGDTPAQVPSNAQNESKVDQKDGVVDEMQLYVVITPY